MRRFLSLACLLAAFSLSAELDIGSQFAVAIEDGDAARVAALIEQGASADTWIGDDENRITPLMKAAWEGHAEIAALLLEKGAKVNAQSPGGKETALLQAVTRGHVETVRILLAAKADVSPQNAYGFNAFTSAVAAGHQEIAAMLLEAGAKIDDGAHTLTPLMFAVSAGNQEMVRWLSEKGAKVNAGVKEGGQTALNLAIMNANAGMVKLLVELKADVNAKMKDGTTPLMAAQKGDQDDIVAILKAAGAK